MPQSLISRLRTITSAEVVAPTDPGFDAARSVFFQHIDRRPAAIVRPQSASDVASAIAVARDCSRPIAIRGGGHSPAGHGVVDGGLVVDLSQMRSLSIDPQRRVAEAGGGLTAGEYTATAAEHGLVTGFGDTASVGIGGLTLGGGIGYLVRKHGLTLDDLLGAEVVTADGQVRFVDESSHPDLFWAIRGGGGNFGVVTRMTFGLHELTTITGGTLVLPASASTIRGFVEAATAASFDLSTIANVMAAPPVPFIPQEHHGRLVIMATLCFAGPLEAADRQLAPFRSIAQPLADMLQPMPYTGLFPPSAESSTSLYPAMRNLLIDDLLAAGAEAIVERLRWSPAPFSAVQIRVLGGAMADISSDATAFAHRQRNVMMNVAAMYADPAEAAEHTSWVDDFATAMSSSDRAAYVNFIGDEGAERVHDAYPKATWDRLVEVKREYDPMNVFMLNQNIYPTS